MGSRDRLAAASTERAVAFQIEQLAAWLWWSGARHSTQGGLFMLGP
jgi:hypothetical protein